MPQAIWNSAAAVGKVNFRLSAQQHEMLLTNSPFGDLFLKLCRIVTVLS